MSSHREIVEQVFDKITINHLWSANYYRMLPISPQNFAIGSVLPALLYMLRWGHRRGKGQFQVTFGKPPTIEKVSRVLIDRHADDFYGFDDSLGEDIFGDLLLAFCLENRRHASAKNQPILHLYPSHYMASWIDLPPDPAHLRRVPEFLASLLGHSEPDSVTLTAYPLSSGFDANPLLALFGRAMETRGDRISDKKSDVFSETQAVEIGIDELLTVRLAQVCKEVPAKMKGGETGEIPQQTAVATWAAQILREDLTVLISDYGALVPRQAFLQMLECCLALGLNLLLRSTTAILSHWQEHGCIMANEEQPTLPLFVDCSISQDFELREFSEEITTLTASQYDKLPTIMMLLRILENYATSDRKISDTVKAIQFDQSGFLELLGDLLHERHPRSEYLLDKIHESCGNLATELKKANILPELAEQLSVGNVNPAKRLAEALIDLGGDSQQGKNYRQLLESTLVTNSPVGLAVKRRGQRTLQGRRCFIDLRSIVLKPPMLDFLVHRHLKSNQADRTNILSLADFIVILRDRYGLYIVDAPPGHSASQDLLLRNKQYLERQLRDMGLLFGVNDAESMKRLKPRYRKEEI